MSPVHTKTERGKKGIKRGSGGKIVKASPGKKRKKSSRRSAGY